MKITIDTSESERVAMQPEYRPMLTAKGVITGTGTGAGEDLVAIDAGPPSDALLQSLGVRGEMFSSPQVNSGDEEAYSSVVVEGMEASRSRH